MTIDERVKENRKLAEWLGLQTEYFCTNAKCSEKHPVIGLPDFYKDEAASALLLEQMPSTHLWKASDGTWHIDPNRGSRWESSPDRKTAIAKAALRLIEGEVQ